MERTLSVEEKIRRAEEIYNRRNGNNYMYQTTSQKHKKGPSLMHRMIKQIIICFIIYGIFYVVTNRDYYLSQDFLTKVEQISSQNEITKKAYDWLNGYIQKYKNQLNENKEENQTQNEETKAEEATGQIENSAQIAIDTNDENIGGSTEETNEVEKTQEQKDIEKVKNTTSFIKPIEGTISSTFGWRTPTTVTVPKYHTGLDIAAKTGTDIQVVADGIVEFAAYSGSYGKLVKINHGNGVETWYAHTSKIYVKVGDEVKAGDIIAAVGSTGNSTGPHLHFEIRINGEHVNPQSYLYK